MRLNFLSTPFKDNANDASGNGNDGTVIDAVLTIDRFNNPACAYAFTSAGTGGPADDQRISIPPTLFGSNTGTISLWFNSSEDVPGDFTSGNDGSITLFLAHEDPFSGAIGLLLGDFTLTLSGEILGSGGGPTGSTGRSAVARSATNTIVTGWHHIAITSDVSGHRFYLDGAEYSPTLFAGGLSASTNLWPLNADVADIGGSVINVGSSDGISKSYSIDDVNIYNRALSSSEINDLFTAPNSCITFSCIGFEPPMDSGPVTVKKNRVLPLKAQLIDSSGNPITDADVASPPVIQVTFDSGTGAAEDVTEQALPAGQGTEGNQFEYGTNEWQYNLKTKNYNAVGTYTITMVSGDALEYAIAPTCTATFVVE